jgi:DNA-binding NarL/FixJ family response regulator
MDATRRESIGNLYRLEGRRLARLSARTADAPAQPLPREQALEPLSAREVAVLQLVADGFANREIGACLSITEETVKSHVRRLLAKLHADNRAHAVSIAFRRGLIG